MSSEWGLHTLEELTDGTPITYGVVKPGDESDDGIAFIRGGDIVAGRILVDQLRTITREVSAQYQRTLLRGGELLISLVGNPGEVAIASPELAGANIARQVGLIRIAPEKAEKNYIQFFLRSKVGRDILLAHSRGSVQQVINLKELKSVKIPLPPMNVQKLIADFMQALDDRIALLRETNATLEAIAQALFKSWFVDFDPVHAKQQGIAPEGMDEATAALFPDGFEESELGLVPRGWKLVPFGSLLTHTIGGDWGDESQNEKNDVRVAIIRGTDIPDLQSGANSRVPIRYTSQKKLSTRKLEDGDIVLEVSGGSKDQPTGRALYLTVGMLAQFDCPVEPASFCRLLRPKTKDIGLLLGQHLTYIYAQGKTWEYQNQSTGIANFQTTHFLATELVAVPSDDVLAGFAETIRPMIERAHLTQMQTLARLRDTLLPRLISGQLRLPEADIAHDRVAAELGVPA